MILNLNYFCPFLSGFEGFEDTKPTNSTPSWGGAYSRNVYSKTIV